MIHASASAEAVLSRLCSAQANTQQASSTMGLFDKIADKFDGSKFPSCMVALEDCA